MLYLFVDFHSILEKNEYVHLFHIQNLHFSLKDAFFFLFMNPEFLLSQYKVNLSSEECYSSIYQDLSIIVL